MVFVSGLRLLLLTSSNMVSVGEDSSKSDNRENLMKQYQSLISPLMFFAFVLSSIFLTPQEQKQVLFLTTFLSKICSLFSLFLYMGTMVINLIDWIYVPSFSDKFSGVQKQASRTWSSRPHCCHQQICC